jgi:hypothetical protein
VEIFSLDKVVYGIIGCPGESREGPPPPSFELIW